MKEVTFLLGIHNHQPVGNFDWVIEDAYRKAYLPFLQTLERHPGIRLALHNSGVLIDWFEEHHPEYLDLVRELANRGQVEPLTGAYYEPILPMIPDDDRVGQIEKLTGRLGARLGARPAGLWLAERVWEPSLAESLARAGVEYLMVDDAHFLAAGLEPDALWNYWLTEDQGMAVAVWPISKTLRYLVPFEPAVKTIEFLKSVASGGTGRVALLADDGEKFGVWPDTYAQVYQRGWLDEFFTLIEQNAGWLHMSLPGEETRRRAPAGRIYLPTASYSEMMEWALPTGVQRTFHLICEKANQAATPEARFLKGGFWRNFLARYPESNLMQKRMLEVRRRLEVSEALPPGEAEAARDDVWQSQCNCAYWHGVFGGLYLPHLRDAIYRRILAAERRIDAFENPEQRVRLEAGDLDRDGSPELRLTNGVVAALVAPSRGGVLSEFDYFPKLRNVSHNLTRRPEAYHDRLIAATRGYSGPAPGTGHAGAPPEGAAGGGSVRSIHDRVEMKEPGLERRLFFDWYRRESLIDHFFRSDTTLEAFDRGDYGEQGDFIDHPYDVDERETPRGRLIRLARQGHVWVHGRSVAVRVEKTLRLDAGSPVLEIDYRVTHDGEEPLDAWFGVEFNFAMLAGHAPDRYYLVNGTRPEDQPNLAGYGAPENVSSVELRDAWDGFAVTLEADRTAGLWRLPVETITQSEAGFERLYQSSCVVPHWRILLLPGEPWRVGLRLAAGEVE